MDPSNAGNREQHAPAERKQAVILSMLGHNDAALAQLESARMAFTEHGRDPELAHCNRAAAMVFGNAGDQESALAAAEPARAVFAKHRLDLEVAHCNFIAGTSLDLPGHTHHALERLEAAHAGFAEQGQDLDKAPCDLTAGAILNNTGQCQAALQRLESAHLIYVTHASTRLDSFEFQGTSADVDRDAAGGFSGCTAAERSTRGTINGHTEDAIGIDPGAAGGGRVSRPEADYIDPP